MDKIKFSMKPDAYQFLTATLSQHKDFLHRLGVNELVKRELIKDVSKIEITLNNAKERKVTNEHSNLDSKPLD